MKNKLYTIGEIYRGKRMLNAKGEPYADKSAVSKAVRKLKYRIIDTQWGPAKAVTLQEIENHNANITNIISTTARKRSPNSKIRRK